MEKEIQKQKQSSRKQWQIIKKKRKIYQILHKGGSYFQITTIKLLINVSLFL